MPGDQRAGRQRGGERNFDTATLAAFVDGQGEAHWRPVEASGDLQQPLSGIARGRDQIAGADAVDGEQARAFGRQLARRRGDAGHALQRDHPPPTGIGPRRQPLRIGIGAGRSDGIQALVGGQRWHGLGQAIVGQAIAEQQVLADIGLRLPVGQRAGAVVHRRLQFPAQRRPVAVADGERARRIGDVAQANQPHLRRTHRREIAIEQLQFGGEVAMAGRGRAIPQQADAVRQRARMHRAGEWHLGMEVARAVEILHERLRLAGRRQAQHQAAGQRRRTPIQRGDPILTLASQRGRHQAIDPLRRDRLPGHANPQRHVRQPARKGQWQAQLPARALAAQRLVDDDAHAALAVRGDRIDAQLELVAGRAFEQTRIDPAALDRLEHFLPLLLGHRHSRTHVAIDIQRKTADLLIRIERKLQLAFELAIVGVGKADVHRGARQRAFDLRRHAQIGHADRLLRVARHQQGPGHLQTRRRGILRRHGARQDRRGQRQQHGAGETGWQFHRRYSPVDDGMMQRRRCADGVRFD